MLAVQILVVLLFLLTLYIIFVGQFDFNAFYGVNCYDNHHFFIPTVDNSCDHILHHCGDTAFKLKFPFRYEGDPSSCGAPEIEISCRDNRSYYITLE